MPKRILRILPNGREVLWGLSRIGGRVTSVIAEGEADVARIELNEWLDSGETISTSAISEQSGVTLSKSNNPTSVDLIMSGVTGNGEALLTITTSTGRKKAIALGFTTPDHACEPDAYRCVGW